MQILYLQVHRAGTLLTFGMFHDIAAPHQGVEAPSLPRPPLLLIVFTKIKQIQISYYVNQNCSSLLLHLRTEVAV